MRALSGRGARGDWGWIKMKHENFREAFSGALSAAREFAPRDTRVEADCDVRVRCDEGEFDAQLVNLSSDGFRLHSERSLQPGAVVILEAAGHDPVQALICWVCGREAGGVFAEAVAL
jgi:hypothetical protein